MNKKFREEIQRVCPEAKIKEKGDKIVILDNKEKEIADVCEGIVEKAGEKAVVKEVPEVIISLESFGQIKIEDIFSKSVEALKKDLDEVIKKLK